MIITSILRKRLTTFESTFMAGCEDCFFGGKKIGARGDITSPFVIVGESPGPLELAQNKPFVGPPGKLLADCLAPFKEALLAKGCEPFITNALNCMPRQKDPSKLAQACNRCHNRLRAELESYPRRVILTLGNAALWSTTGTYSYKITQERGKVFESPLASHGIVAAVHPSFLLRGGGNLGQFKRDITVACQLVLGITANDAAVGSDSSGGKETWGVIKASDVFRPGKYAVLKTAEEVAKLATRLKTVEYAACDFETDGFDPLKGSDVNPPATLGKGIICAGICFKRGITYVVPGELLTPALFENDVKWCWQNGKYDLRWGWHYGLPVRVDDDTMLMSYLLNERGGIHDLEQLGNDWLQAPNYKNMLEVHLPSRKHSYAHIPREVLYEYQAIDAELTFWLRDVLREHIIRDPHLKKAYERILIPGSAFLAGVESDGILVDEEKVKENVMRLGGLAATYEKEFQRIASDHGILGINIRSPQQVQALLYGKLKLHRDEKHSTDANTLDTLPNHPAVIALKQYRKVHKMLSTFVTPIWNKVDTHNRLHTTFKLHGTTTGRLASNKPNLQNIPRDKEIRGQFIAGPGRCILEVDLAQAELRVLACLSADAEMIRIFKSGVSLHDEVAEYLFGKGFNKEQKMIAKNINFGIIYGITPHGLFDQLSIGATRQGSSIQVSTRQCSEWITGWFERFPEASKFLKRCKEAPQKGVTLVSAFGRKRRFGVVSHEKLRDLQNEAMNFPEQSAAHDITLLAGIEVRNYVRETYDCIIVNEVHDCLVNDLPDDMGVIVPCAKYIMAAMERVPVEWGLNEIPFLAEAEVGYRWGMEQKLSKEVFTMDLNDLRGKSHAAFI